MVNYTEEQKFNFVLEARNRTYSPYSKFGVGACAIMRDGKVYYGCNIENASYGLSMCAERTCMYNVIVNGDKTSDIVELLVIGDTDKPISPCGACRQVMGELLSSDAIITLYNLKKEKVSFHVIDLLPYPFTDGDLDA